MCPKLKRSNLCFFFLFTVVIPLLSTLQLLLPLHSIVPGFVCSVDEADKKEQRSDQNSSSTSETEATLGQENLDQQQQKEQKDEVSDLVQESNTTQHHHKEQLVSYLCKHLNDCVCCEKPFGVSIFKG